VHFQAVGMVLGNGQNMFGGNPSVMNKM
jgi:hypothetical protein